ncbi:MULTISPECIES: helix-turn-helix domain-containing protein [Rhodopirellula]|nr:MULTISPECIES: helix-turn-helix transcriptional regulator [Rhodopirellula]
MTDNAGESFGERVRQLRSLRSLPQTELASCINVSISYISKVENQKLHP